MGLISNVRDMIGLGRPRLPSVPKAEAALAKYRKLEAAIAEGVAAMPALIEAREAAEGELARLEVERATGSAADADVESAREKVGAARARIEDAGRSLANLRLAADAMGSELGEVVVQLNKEIPEYGAALLAELTAEWEEMALQFSRLQGRRKALERLTGKTLDLPEPAPATVEVSETPYRVLESVVAVVSKIASQARRNMRATSANVPITDGVFVMRRAMGGLEVGDKLTRWTFGDDELRDLLALGVAVPADEARYRKGVDDAAKAMQKLEEAHQAELKRKEQERAEEYRRERAAQVRKDLKRRFPGLTDAEIQKELKRIGQGHLSTEAYLYADPAEASSQRFQNAVRGT